MQPSQATELNMFNHLNEDHQRELRAQIADCALALSQGAVPLLEGVRRLAALSFDGVGRNGDPDFGLFVAIDSQTDHLPAATARSFCSAAWLHQCDRELADIESFYGSDINSACERLIARFGSEA